MVAPGAADLVVEIAEVPGVAGAEAEYDLAQHIERTARRGQRLQLARGDAVGHDRR